MTKKLYMILNLYDPSRQIESAIHRARERLHKLLRYVNDDLYLIQTTNCYLDLYDNFRDDLSHDQDELDELFAEYDCICNFNSLEHNEIQANINHSFTQRIYYALGPSLPQDGPYPRNYVFLYDRPVPRRLTLYNPAGEIVFMNDDADTRCHHIAINDVCDGLYHPDWGHAPVGAFYGDLHLVPRPARAT